MEGKSLRSICLQDGMPTKTTVFRWLQDDRYAKFRDQYAYAREVQGDGYADETVDIADDGTNDYMVDPETGETKYDGDSVNRSRLRVDARKWAAGKLNPKKYGDKTLLGNADGSNIDFDDTTAAHKMNAILAAALARNDTATD